MWYVYIVGRRNDGSPTIMPPSGYIAYYIPFDCDNDSNYDCYIMVSEYYDDALGAIASIQNIMRFDDNIREKILSIVKKMLSGT